MTCIAALRSDGFIYMAADSAGTDWTMSREIRGDSKIFRVGEFLIGFAGSFRGGQLLKHSFSPPPLPQGEDLEKYMVSQFVDAMRETFKEGGSSLESFCGPEGTPAQILVGVRGDLFRVQNDYQVARPTTDYMALGCGRDLALGSLWSTPETLDPIQRLSMALGAAQRFNASVAEPFHFLQIPESAPMPMPGQGGNA